MNTHEYVLRPIPILDADFKLQNMKSYLGCILQCTNNDDPVDDPLLYSVLLNTMQCNTEWMMTGEDNKDGIHHVHAIIKCNMRSDSWRRSYQTAWENVRTHPSIRTMFGTELSTDILKCQKVHKFESLAAYICKQPKWCVSSTERLGQIMYDIHNWDLGARFRATEKEKEPDTGNANPMIQELLQCIREHNCHTMEDVMRSDPEMCCKYLHRPGFGTIVQNCLQFQKCCGEVWNLKQYAKYEVDPSAVHKVLLHQGIQPTAWDVVFYQWVTKKHPKKNTIVLLGPSNTGKSSFVKGFGQICPGGECINGQSFNYEGLLGMYWGKWEEPLIGPEQVEKFKQIAEGMDTHIPVKYKKPQLLPRTPILMTTNSPPWRWCKEERFTLQNRMHIFKFKYDVSSGMYICRTSEPSCECFNCKASRGGTSPISHAAITEMHRTERSEESGEHMAGSSTTKRDVGTGSMPKRKRDSSSVRARSRSRQQCTSITEPRSSTSSTISDSTGSNTGDGSSNSRKRICSSGSGNKQYVQSTITWKPRTDDNRRDAESYGSGDEGCSSRSPERNPSSHNVVSMGGTGIQESETTVQTEEQRVDREMGTLTIPTKEQWKSYLAYLWSIYDESPPETLSHCYFDWMFSETEDD